MNYMDQVLRVYGETGRLKNEDRARRGWLLRGIPGRVESVSEHCFSMINLAVLLDMRFDLGLDFLKILKMITVHEYGEVKVGDITPRDNVSAKQKYQMEKTAIKEVIGDDLAFQEIINLWEEFEAKETREAVFVYLLDKYQSVLQAKEYATNHDMPELLAEFYEYYANFLKTMDRNTGEDLRELLSLGSLG